MFQSGNLFVALKKMSMIPFEATHRLRDAAVHNYSASFLLRTSEPVSIPEMFV